MKEKLHDFKENVAAFFTYPFVHLRFIYKTEIYPRKAKHHWCRFYDWVAKTEKEGWYVLDVTSSQSEYIMAHLARKVNGFTIRFSTRAPKKFFKKC